MDPNATIVISDSDSDNENPKAKEKSATSRHFIPILPKSAAIDKPTSTSPIKTKRQRHTKDNPHFTSNFSQIAVKGFAKEKKNTFKEATQLNLISVNNQPVILTKPPGKFVNIADTHTNSSEYNAKPSEVIKPISVLGSHIIKNDATQNKNIGTATKFIRTSSNKTPVSKSHCPKHVHIKTVEPKTDLENKIVNINDIINKTISGSLGTVQASGVRTNISKNVTTNKQLHKNSGFNLQQLRSPVLDENSSDVIDNNSEVQQIVTKACQNISQILNKKIKNPKNTATTETLQENNVPVSIERVCGNVGINLQLLQSTVLHKSSSDVQQTFTKASNKSVPNVPQTQSNRTNMSKNKTTTEALQTNNIQASGYQFCDCNEFNLPQLQSTSGVINNSDIQETVTKNVRQTSNKTNISKNVDTLVLPQTNNISTNNTQQALGVQLQPPVLYLNSSNVINNSDVQQIVAQTSNMNVQNMLQIPSSLPGLLMGLPPLQKAQNIYIIKIPSNTQLALNYTPHSNQVQSVNNQQINVGNTPNTPMVVENPETSTSVSNISLNQNVTIAKENSPKKCVTAHRCLNLRKSNAKLDFEGFTCYDRLGFFKAEETRAKRCMNILKAHIKIRESVVRGLLEKQAAHNKQNEKVPFRNRMEKLVEKCKNLENQVPVTTSNKKTIKTTSQVIQKINEVDGPKIVKKKKKQNNYDGYNLKELRIVVKREEVEQYLRMKRKEKLKKKNKLKNQKCLAPLKDKPEVSKQKVSIIFSNHTTLKDILSFNLNNSMIFIDENYFEIIEKLYHSESQIYFVNKHAVMTCLYMEYFPLFKTAVQTKKVRIIDTSVFETYISLRSRSKDVSVTTYCNLYKNSKSKWRNRLKRANFCKRVADFHSMQKINQHYPKIVLSEHNYYTPKKT